MAQEACGMRQEAGGRRLLASTSHSFKLTDVNYILCGKNNNRPRTETWQRIKIHTLTVKDCWVGPTKEREKQRKRERERERRSEISWTWQWESIMQPVRRQSP